ncbi:NAD(P)H-dependent flavin oxidoreductase [Allosphingosinicella sp.]|uniref:NAD(P)H-dependent flavin oxidoreductase n=1 Tax=Allosphingosinicella sp. TaxID=2823234 RepID=UPI003783B787
MSTWPDRRFLALSGARLPIVQAPMAGAGGVALAIAALKGGAVGSLPCAMRTPGEMIAEAAEVRAAAVGPLNLNFFCHELPEEADDSAWRTLLRPVYEAAGIPLGAGGGAVRQPFRDELCTAVEDIRPDLVSFHFGLPGDALLERVRRTGAKLIGNATTVAEARALAEVGVDAIIAQGWEGGGHAGRFLDDPPDEQMGLMALLPQIVDAVSVPVIAAGGIGDARGIAAAFLLGASAVQLGTAYLHCPESLIGKEHRAGLTSELAEQTAFTNLYSGGLARGLPTKLTDAFGPIREEAPPFPLASLALAPLGLKPHFAGQAARLGRAEGAEPLTERLGREALALLAGKA